jgi:hypothetical protein
MQTAVKSLNQIAQEIDDYINKSGGGYSSWYVGIASDPRIRLFNDHNVDEKNDYWIYRACGSDTSARKVEEYFINKGCKGGTGGGDYTTQSVYAYKIGRNTVE